MSDLITPRVIERFWKNVNKTEACWLWTGRQNGHGYGTMYGAADVRKSPIGAHRVSWMIHRGEIDDGLHVCHTCDVRNCVNPDHLFLGTQKDNMRDAIRKGRFEGWQAGKSYPNPNKGKHIPMLIRFFELVEFADCWIWQGTICNGYPMIGDEQNYPITARRASWMMAKGQLPSKACVRATCKNKLCVNPTHLYLAERGNKKLLVT